MNRPSKKDIKAAVDRLKDKPSGPTSSGGQDGKLSLGSKKDNRRIRKQGV